MACAFLLGSVDIITASTGAVALIWVVLISIYYSVADDLVTVHARHYSPALGRWGVNPPGTGSRPALRSWNPGLPALQRPNSLLKNPRSSSGAAGGGGATSEGTARRTSVSLLDGSS